MKKCFILLLLCFATFSLPAFSLDENVSGLVIVHQPHDGELAVTANPNIYSGFTVNNNENRELLFMANYVPINLLSNTVGSAKKTDVKESKFSFDAKHENSNVPASVGFKRPIF